MTGFFYCRSFINNCGEGSTAEKHIKNFKFVTYNFFFILLPLQPTAYQ